MSVLADSVSRIKFSKPASPKNSRYWFSIVERYYNLGTNARDINAVYPYFVPEENVKWERGSDGNYTMVIDPTAFKRIEDRISGIRPHDIGIYPTI